MKPLYEKSSALQNHLLKTRSLQCEVKVGDSGEAVEAGLGSIEITNAANGLSTLKFPKEILGDVQAVKSVEIVDSGAAVVLVVTKLVDVDGDVVITLNSDSDYTTDDDILQVRICYKLK